MSTSFPSGNDTSAPVAIDPVTAFLHARRFDTSVAYLGQSEFELGRRLLWKGLDLVYRYERGALLICDVEATGAPEALDGAVRRLVAFIRALERHVPEVEVVTGLIPLRSADPSLDAVRSRLLSVYERLGAQPVSSEAPGMVKVVYPMHASTALPSRHAMAVPTAEAVETALRVGDGE
ncbi:hypothetical protein CURE108131_04520 [Cupriavidus respiraculi]|uniref:Uncharacterized protein n=1 Tax=Cupriavidus respiraculi TaxID=195930 RepID=A0ABM8WJG8_9BURK|nr:hypothetical protein [Cupriavidus respiraculi]CAG9167546.1 hypothetical protein LMG21510_00776 [Cupriavidus respiraculi]